MELIRSIRDALRRRVRSIRVILPRCAPALRHRPRRIGSARLAQEAEGARRLIKTPDRISERPPRGGLSVFARLAGYTVSGKYSATHTALNLDSIPVLENTAVRLLGVPHRSTHPEET